MSENHIIPRLPGSKAKFISEIVGDYSRYDAIIEPFAGAAHYSIWRASHALFAPKQVFLGETDGSLRAIYGCWFTSDEAVRARVLKGIEWWKDLFRDALIDDENAEAEEGIEFDASKGSIQKAWRELENSFMVALNEFERNPLDEMNKTSLTAASLCVRKLTFGGVLRTSKADPNEYLGVTYVKCQVPALISWDYRFPELPPAHFSLQLSYVKAIEAFRESDLNSAEALIDPPYYLPEGTGVKCTPSYMGHEPHDISTMHLCTDAVSRCLKDPRIKRIVVTNYYSEQLATALRRVIRDASQRNLRLWYSMDVMKPLNTMNNAGNEKPVAIHCVWEIVRTAKNGVDVDMTSEQLTSSTEPSSRMKMAAS